MDINYYRTTKFILFVLIAILFSCKNDVEIVSLDQKISELNLEPLPEVAFPFDNPSNDAKVKLGKLLFWDPIVSGEKDVACATCHHPDFGYTDGLDLSIGVRGSGLGPNRTQGSGIDRVPRNAPSILNTAFNGLMANNSYQAEESIMFWDGRMKGLENQCQGPPTSRSEMKGDTYLSESAMANVVLKLRKIPRYVDLFDSAFGNGIASLTIDNYARAIASFERTIISTNSPYDQYLKGNSNALTEQQKNGLLIFFGKAKCNDCHSGPMLSDWTFHALGVSENPNRVGNDFGKDSLFLFRTPTLRNISLSGPYMHNGTQSSLNDVMLFYNEGKSQNENITDVSPFLVPLNLSDEEIESVVEFLKSLTDENFDKSIPESVPSGLKVGGNI